MSIACQGRELVPTKQCEAYVVKNKCRYVPGVCAVSPARAHCDMEHLGGLAPSSIVLAHVEVLGIGQLRDGTSVTNMEQPKATKSGGFP